MADERRSPKEKAAAVRAEKEKETEERRKAKESDGGDSEKLDRQARQNRARQEQRGDGFLEDDSLPFKKLATREIDRQLKGGRGNIYTGSKPEPELEDAVPGGRKRPPIYKSEPIE